VEAKNLWGNLDITRIPETPAVILQAQAGMLGELTNNIVLARLDNRSSRDNFSYDLDLYVPALDGYIFTLLRIQYDIRLYPVVIYELFGSEGRGVQVENETQFVEQIESILSSEDVHRIIYSLMGQAKAEGVSDVPF